MSSIQKLSAYLFAAIFLSTANAHALDEDEKLKQLVEKEFGELSAYAGGKKNYYLEVVSISNSNIDANLFDYQSASLTADCAMRLFLKIGENELDYRIAEMKGCAKNFPIDLKVEYDQNFADYLSQQINELYYCIDCDYTLGAQPLSAFVNTDKLVTVWRPSPRIIKTIVGKFPYSPTYKEDEVYEALSSNSTLTLYIDRKRNFVSQVIWSINKNVEMPERVLKPNLTLKYYKETYVWNDDLGGPFLESIEYHSKTDVLVAGAAQSEFLKIIDIYP
ncbi:MAG: hypothetical protein DHS20C05_11850 [Hyphococcus sp.]|nr:MAG: hypothetical protein DHS20C05_11850 [Marinicaulis sp.]